MAEEIIEIQSRERRQRQYTMENEYVDNSRRSRSIGRVHHDDRRSKSEKRKHSRSKSGEGRKGGSVGRDGSRDSGKMSRSSGGSGGSGVSRSDSFGSDISDGFQPKGILTLKEAFEPLFKLFGMRATGNIFKDFGLLADALEDEIQFARAIFGFIFDAYDEDGNGTIEEDELGVLIHDIGEATGDNTLKHIQKENIRAIMDILDDDGNGEIDKKEFVDYMVSWLELGGLSDDDEEEGIDDSDTDSEFL